MKGPVELSPNAQVTANQTEVHEKSSLGVDAVFLVTSDLQWAAYTQFWWTLFPKTAQAHHFLREMAVVLALG